MKLTIVTGIWQRPEVYELFAKGVKDLKCRGLKIECVVAGSEGRLSKSRASRYGFIYTEQPNQPLSKKMNTTLDIARELDSDYVLCMGSDDIISNELLKVYHKEMNKGTDFVGVTDFYFYDLVSDKAIYWAGYREMYRYGHTCGAARLISKRLLNKLDWKLWELEDDRQLDTSFQKKLDSIKHKSKTFSLKEIDCLAVDIKSSQNMTPFALWDNSEYISPEILKDKFKLCAG